MTHSEPHPLNAAPLGTRFSVRFRIDDDGGRHTLTDVLGVLRERNSTSVVLETRSGELRTVEKRRIVAAKPVPPPPARRPRNGGRPDESERV